MGRFRVNSLLVILFALMMQGLGFPCLLAQSNYYKFPVTKEGVYKITKSQAIQLGVNSVDELSIYGYGGMLPQKLDSSIFDLMEIPVKKINGDLFFFLSAAPTVELVDGMAHYQPHYFSDTLYYLLQTRRPHKAAIPKQSYPKAQDSSTMLLYRTEAYKKEETNLLSSGRNWYGNRVFGGETISIDVGANLSRDLPLYYSTKLMAQSLTESKFHLSVNGGSIETVTLPSITNSIYGLKGQEKQVAGLIKDPVEGDKIQFKLLFETGDRNGTGYLEYLIIGLPFPSTNLPEGVFLNLSLESFNLKTSPLQWTWDVSEFFRVKDITSPEGQYSDARKIAIFTPEKTPAIKGWERVDMDVRSQRNIAKLIIITHPLLRSEAERLARHKNERGTSTQVVTVKEIYDSFGYGNPDITALRNFIAVQYHQGKQLENVLLFGKGTFDYKNKFDGRPNLVPTYSSRSSLNPLTTYSSDDYFGFLKLGEGNWEETEAGDLGLSIGVGRLPVIDFAEARAVVDKIIHYESPGAASGDWKRKVLFIADDGDNNIHLKDSESLASHLSENYPEFVLEKLYLDAFEQLSSGSSQSSPKARTALESLMDSSVLLVNYIGHGNETTLMAERVFQVSDLKDWPENSRLPVFVTATCEFGRHDSPFLRSGAEELLIAEKKGAISLLSTGRPVFSTINFALNKAFIEAVFEKKEGRSLTLGEIFKRTKNRSLNGPLNRNFSLLGDPSLRLALPEFTAFPEEYFDVNLQAEVDTLKSMQQIRYRGRISQSTTGEKVELFNGTFEISFADKPFERKGLGDESTPATYVDDQIFIHRGKGKVVNGFFEGEVLIPKNIDYGFGEGTARVFAQDEKTRAEAFGAAKITVGGSSKLVEMDQEGPTIHLFIQDTTASVETISSTTVKFLATLEDQNGINISPIDPGQDISLRINNGEALNLSPYFKALNGSFSSGFLEVTLGGLQEGRNKLTLQAWDNIGNSSSQTIELRVSGSKKIAITSHLIYPNPASTESHFQLTHNRQGENLDLQIRIYSLLGSEIFSVTRRFPKAKPFLEDTSWIFMESKTNYPAKGTYIYELVLKSEDDGSLDRKSGKIIIQ